MSVVLCVFVLPPHPPPGGTIPFVTLLFPAWVTSFWMTVMILTWPLPGGPSMLGKLRPDKGKYRKWVWARQLPYMARVKSCIPSALRISEPIYPLIPC